MPVWQGQARAWEWSLPTTGRTSPIPTLQSLSASRLLAAGKDLPNDWAGQHEHLGFMEA
jgi:hypothetical protein